MEQRDSGGICKYLNIQKYNGVFMRIQKNPLVAQRLLDSLIQLRVPSINSVMRDTLIFTI